MLQTYGEYFMVHYGWWLGLTAMAMVLVIALVSDIVAKRSLRQIAERKEQERAERQEGYYVRMLEQDKNWYGEHSKRSPLKDKLPPKIGE